MTKFPNLTFILKMGSKGSRFISNTHDVYANVATALNPNILKDYTIIDTVGAGR